MPRFSAKPLPMTKRERDSLIDHSRELRRESEIIVEDSKRIVEKTERLRKAMKAKAGRK